MDKPLPPKLDASDAELSESPHTDTTQGSEYLDDAIRMIEQPLESPKQSE